MPKVGTGKDAKHFPYTKKGVKEAKRMAKEKGMEFEYKEKKKK